MSLPIIFEDNHLIAVNKPAGVLVHADATEDRTLEDYVKQYIKIRYNKPGDVFLGTIHRIDRPVSGVVVFARTSKALTRMNKLFQERAVEKTYWAITRERPPALSGELAHYIYKDRSKNTSKAFDELSSRAKANNAKHSQLHYRVIAGANNRTVLEIKPKTGRPHQIRVQLQKMGCPIVGDLRYGYPSPLHDASIALHSRNLSFTHPVKKEPVSITAEPPNIQEWKQFAETLNF
ncbi:MAG: RluA family pseudouridine synthase [Bacteroidota bacterium]